MVLHFIDKSVQTADNSVFDYLPALLSSLSAETETCVFVPLKADFTAFSEAAHVIRYHSSIAFATINLRLFAKEMNKARPCVAHIHGCCSCMSALFMRQCERLGIPIIITTGKQFEPWHLRHRFWYSHFPKLALFQRHMLRHACALHALNSQDQNSLLHLSWHPLFKARKPLNDRVSVIQNFNRTQSYTCTGMCKQMAALYSKVADSNPFMLMTSADKRCEDIMLAVGIAPKDATVHVSDKDGKLLTALDDTRMRRILLHAADEGIYKYIIDTALRFKIRLPALNINGLSRFKSYYYRAETTEENDDTSNYEERINTDETLTDAERAVCRTLLSTWHKYRNKSLHRSDLAILCRQLRYTDYNEVLLCHALRRQHFIHRAARLLCILGERYGLTEGFMFIEPIDDHSTRRMRNQLNRLGVQ